MSAFGKRSSVAGLFVPNGVANTTIEQVLNTEGQRHFFYTVVVQTPECGQTDMSLVGKKNGPALVFAENGDPSAWSLPEPSLAATQSLAAGIPACFRFSTHENAWAACRTMRALFEGQVDQAA